MLYCLMNFKPKRIASVCESSVKTIIYTSSQRVRRGGKGAGAKQQAPIVLVVLIDCRLSGIFVFEFV